jgi:hypothetical protein
MKKLMHLAGLSVRVVPSSYVKERDTLKMMDIELQLAIRCAALPPAQAAASWNKLMQIVTFEDLSHSSQRILPKIFKNLEAFINLPFYEKLMGAYKFNWVKNNRILMPFTPIIAELNNQMIDYRLLKGAALNLSSNSIGERVMGDIDLLIKTENLNQIVKILKSNNYKQKYATLCPNEINDMVEHELCFVSPQNFEVDLHLVEKSYPKALFKEMINTSPVEVIFNGTKAKIPSKELTLIHSAKHGQQSVGVTDSIQSYIDINELLRRIDFGTLQTKSNKVQLTEIVNVYLENLNQLTNQKYPTIKNTRKKLFKLPINKFNFFDNERIFMHLREIIKTRQVSKWEVEKIFTRFKGKRYIYLVWIKLGKPRHFERVVLQLFGGFLQTPRDHFQTGNSSTSFVSNAQKWIVTSQVSSEAHDWRFKLKQVQYSKKTSIELFSENFKNWNWLVFVNGKLQGTTLQNSDGIYIIELGSYSKVLEISLRSPSHVCELCEYGLSDLRIRILG